ncbi:MAG: ribonuclease HII [Opitutaceae bacterium]|nr:ribonuclease HII [Cytophagales bacterium]
MKNTINQLFPYFKSDCIEAGLDEAGRGCLAGPVVAAAVILPSDYWHSSLNDSKKLTSKQREELRIEIEREAIEYKVSFVCNREIDSINILNASFLAMNHAIRDLTIIPEHSIIDGNRFRPQPFNTIPYTCVIKGDGKYFSIAAASVLAKTYRDDYMRDLHDSYPQYNWNENKGYATESHRKNIKKHGISPYHRKSFTLFETQIDLFESGIETDGNRAVVTHIK